MNTQSRVAVGILPRGLDPLFFDALLEKVDLYYLVEADSPTEVWARSFLPQTHILSYVFSKPLLHCLKNLEDILQHSNIGEVLNKHGVSSFLVNHMSEECAAWQKQTGISLISVPLETRKKLENKISFDSWMQANGITKPSSRVVALSELHLLDLSGKVVIQTAESMGAEGTFFAQNAAELTAVQSQLFKQKPSSDTQLLVRSFVEGRVFGISTLSGETFQAISGVRVQCYDRSALAGQDIYSGLTWVNDIPDAHKKNIADSIFHLLDSLNAQGYWGLLNFDFILSPAGEVYVLECNARYSAATGLTVIYPELMGGYNTNEELVKQHFGWNNVEGNPTKRLYNGLLDSTFEGSAGCVNFYPTSETPSVQVVHQKPSGIYRFNSGELQFITSDVRLMQSYGEEQLLIYTSEAAIGEVYSEYVSTGCVVSNWPLFTSDGVLSETGQQVMHFFSVQ